MAAAHICPPLRIARSRPTGRPRSMSLHRHHPQGHLKTRIAGIASIAFTVNANANRHNSLCGRRFIRDITPATRSHSILSITPARYQHQQAAQRPSSLITQTSQKPQQSSSGLHRAMSNKLAPTNPGDVMVIRDITPNVTILSVPFARAGLLEVGGRCTIVRMTGGGVLVFSPVSLTPDAAAVVTRLGGKQGVKYLVAPDLEHHIFLSEWAKAYPAARIVAPQGLPEKRAATNGKNPKISVDDTFFAVLADKRQQPLREPQSVAPDFDADFGLVYFDMHPNREVVLLYRPDRIVIQADLMFNLPAIEQYKRVDQATRRGAPGHANFLNRIFQAVMRTEGNIVWAQRFQWYIASKGDRARFNEGLRVVDSWPFETIIPCHGETIEKNAKEVFRKVFAWHFDDKET